MLKIRNAAICSWPTTNRPQRSPGTGNSGARNSKRAGASNATVPTRRNSTNTMGGASASASFISGQLPAQVTTMTARYR